MRTPINTEYRNLTVYFNIHASLLSKFKAYSPKSVIKFLAPTILPYPKIHRRGTYRIIYSLAPQSLPENLTTNLPEKLFLKNRVS